MEIDALDASNDDRSGGVGEWAGQEQAFERAMAGDKRHALLVEPHQAESLQFCGRVWGASTCPDHPDLEPFNRCVHAFLPDGRTASVLARDCGACGELLPLVLPGDQIGPPVTGVPGASRAERRRRAREGRA